MDPNKPQPNAKANPQAATTQPTSPDPAPNYNLNFNPNIHPEKNPSEDDLVFGPAPRFPARPQNPAPQPAAPTSTVAADTPASPARQFFTPKTIVALVFAVLLLIAGTIITIVFMTRPTNPASQDDSVVQKPDSDNPRPATIIYVDNDTINNFAKTYNSLYPNNRITTGMLKPVTNDGIENPDQVEFFFQNSDIILSGDDATSTASVFFSNPDKQDNSAIQQLFNDFMRVYNNKLTDEELATDWETITNKPASISTLHDIECRVTMRNRHVDYILLKGVLK